MPLGKLLVLVSIANLKPTAEEDNVLLTLGTLVIRTGYAFYDI